MNPRNKKIKIKIINICGEKFNLYILKIRNMKYV